MDEPLNPSGVRLLLLAILGPPPQWDGTTPPCCRRVGGMCNRHVDRLVTAAIRQQLGAAVNARPTRRSG